MKNPFNFAATVYATELYRRVEGYGGGRLYNPDKWFHWKVLGAADMAYFIDAPAVRLSLARRQPGGAGERQLR